MTGSSLAWARVLFATLALTTACKKNQAPYQAAIPSGPLSGLPGDLLSFRSSASDPDDDSVAIRFDWGDGDTSPWRNTARGVPVADSHSWAASDTYLVRAQARDARGDTSEWSDPHSLAIVHLPPELLLSGARYSVAGDTFKLYAILFAAESESVAVRVSWGNGDTTGWTEFFPTDYEPITLHYAWADTGSYLVTAQAKDQSGFTSGWLEACSVCVWRPKWRYTTGGNVRGCPAVAADGSVYFGSDDGWLYAVTDGGNLLWSYETGDRIWSSPALAADGTVYVGSMDGCVYAIDPTGALKWSYKTDGMVSSSPALATDGTAYVGSFDSCLYAIDPSGTLKWRYATGGYIMSSPAVAADGTVYVADGFDPGYLYAIDPAGALKWRCDVGHTTESSPAVAADGTVYLGTLDGHVHAVNPNGTLKWDCRTWGDVQSSPAVAADGTVYVGSDSGLQAIDPTGHLKWRFYEGCWVHSSPTLAADGTVYFGALNAYLYAVTSGTLKWRYEIGTSMSLHAVPAIAADGTVYVGSDDGVLYAIKGDSPLADSPWPKFHHDARNSGRVGGR
jgi:outer membrane protein assembly factor BamB